MTQNTNIYRLKLRLLKGSALKKINWLLFVLCPQTVRYLKSVKIHNIFNALSLCMKLEKISLKLKFFIFLYLLNDLFLNFTTYTFFRN